MWIMDMLAAVNYYFSTQRMKNHVKRYARIEKEKKIYDKLTVFIRSENKVRSYIKT